jgi:hypothetical protein
MRIEKGKLIVNIENSILSDAGNINDMLSRTPGLITDAGGSISVPGKGSPIIYINNKEINSSAELNSLQPGDISKIEIIKNPSSKYSASGRAVIIIKTKKAKNNTTMLQVNDNMTIARKFSNITGLQLTQNIDKYSGMYSYSYGEYNQKQYLNQYQTISNSDYKMSSISDFTQTFKNRGHNIFAGIDYRIFKEHSFGLQFSGRFSDNFKYEDRMQTISKTNVNANELRKIRLDGETDTDFFNVDFNYRINPDSVNNFNFIAGYARQNYNNVNNIDESVVSDISINNSIINTNNKYNVYSFVADYQFNLKNLFITEIGGKASIIDNDGFSNHYYWPSIVQKSYNTNLTKEKIFAGYFN